MLEMKCPTCGSEVVVDNNIKADNNFVYYHFKCVQCGHESEFALRSVQDGSEC